MMDGQATSVTASADGFQDIIQGVLHSARSSPGLDEPPAGGGMPKPSCNSECYSAPTRDSHIGRRHCDVGQRVFRQPRKQEKLEWDSNHKIIFDAQLLRKFDRFALSHLPFERYQAFMCHIERNYNNGKPRRGKFVSDYSGTGLVERSLEDPSTRTIRSRDLPHP
jgi:hypothetical protein